MSDQEATLASILSDVHRRWNDTCEGPDGWVEFGPYAASWLLDPPSWVVSGWRPAPDSLDAAWAEAEAALPEGAWAVEVIGRLPDYLANAYGDDESRDAADPRMSAAGSTPAAALRALAAKLREVPR